MLTTAQVDHFATFGFVVLRGPVTWLDDKATITVQLMHVPNGPVRRRGRDR